MAKKMVYVVVDYSRDLYDGDSDTSILGVAPTIEKADEYIKNYSGFYGRITNDAVTNDDVMKGRLTRVVMVRDSVDGHAWEHKISAYGRFMIE